MVQCAGIRMRRNVLDLEARRAAFLSGAVG